MHLRANFNLVLLLASAAAVASCNNDNINNSSVQIARFQIVASASDTMMLDAATGDLWKLEEGPGDEGARWVRYADAPSDVKAVDLDRILRPERPEEGGDAAEEPHDDQPDAGEPQDGVEQPDGGEQRDGEAHDS